MSLKQDRAAVQQRQQGLEDREAALVHEKAALQRQKAQVHTLAPCTVLCVLMCDGMIAWC